MYTAVYKYTCVLCAVYCLLCTVYLTPTGTAHRTPLPRRLIQRNGSWLVCGLLIAGTKPLEGLPALPAQYVPLVEKSHVPNGRSLPHRPRRSLPCLRQRMCIVQQPGWVIFRHREDKSGCRTDHCRTTPPRGFLLQVIGDQSLIWAITSRAVHSK